jgi:hypothetical protein
MNMGCAYRDLRVRIRHCHRRQVGAVIPDFLENVLKEAADSSDTARDELAAVYCQERGPASVFSAHR